MTDNLSADLASLRIDRSSPPPSRSWLRLLLWPAVAGAAAAAYVLAAPYVEAQLFKTAVTATQIVLVSPAQASVELTATGYVQAEIVSRVAPKVPGRVLAVYVSQGDAIEAGKLLLELDPADDKASIRAAQSEVSAALAQAESAKARAEVAKANLADAQQRAARERGLATQGVTTTASADDLEAAVHSLQQSVVAAQADARAATASAGALNARVDVLRTGMRNLELSAPISGTVLNKPPQIGEYVGPQPPGVTVDMGGIRIADLSSLVVETDIPETRLSQVRAGAPVEIVLDAFPARRFRGTVKQITPLVDRAKATVVVKVAFTDSTAGVLPDMSARVSVLTKALEEKSLEMPAKLVVPASAVAVRSGRKVVFVLEGGKAKMVTVKLGSAVGSGFELLSGPAEGTSVVADPPRELADGQAVKSEG